MKNWLAKIEHTLSKIREFLDEKAFHSPELKPLSRVQKFAHFWLTVWKSFSRNRCPSRASALAYTTLIALIPVLFIVVSVSNSVLGKEGSDRVTHFIDKLLVSMTPPVITTTNSPASLDTNAPANDASTNTQINLSTNSASVENTNNTASSETNAIAGRRDLVRTVNQSIRNIQSGTLGVTGIAGLIVAAIFMLRSIESTFNDIWGVAHGRSWWAQIVQYSAVLVLGPTLLALAVGLASGAHLHSPGGLLERAPFIGELLFRFAPVVLLCLAFGFFYMVMPNTKVHWCAALVGGGVGGVLWHLNNYFSVLYISRWVSNSNIYGNLAIIPVFMAGLYMSWLILLFGSQVAYAFQNRSAYLQEKQSENVNQRGREFVALRLMACVGQRFHRAELPPTVPDIAEGLSVPSRLIQQIMETLLAARLVIEVTGDECGYAPARPLEQITCHDILLAMRAGQGHELTTRDDAARAGVFGEFEKILEAEQRAASSVTVLAMVERNERLAALSDQHIKVVTDGKS